MRNLKRALSLAMASVMLLGMMVVGTSAGYADVTSEHNEEAIAVAQAAGIMIGDEAGNFNPDQKVTRNEMAVIMANMLGLKPADYAGTNPFTDVPDWAANYVGACYANGIVSGVSATEYNGSATVTAAEASLMMLKALGYFQYAEDFGDDWMMATVKQAAKIELTDGIDAGAKTALTRNDVALLVLNALEEDVVDFTGTVGSNITTSDGTEITIGYRSEYDGRYTTSYNYDNSDSNRQQLVEKLFKEKLTKNNKQRDDFQRPANQWKWDGKEIGVFAKTPDVTYSAEAKGKALYADLGLDETFKGASVYVNGESDGTIDIIKNDEDKANRVGGNGTTTEVFVTKSSSTGTITAIDVIEIQNLYGKIASVGKNSDDERIVRVAGMEYKTESFAKDDVVLYTKAKVDNKWEIKSMVANEKQTGKITKTVGNDFYIDGTKYSRSQVIAKVDGKTGDNVDFYVDQYGYIVHIEKSDDEVNLDNLAYVITAANARGNYAELRLADGTKMTVDTDKDYKALIGHIVSFKETTDGYELKDKSKAALNKQETTEYKDDATSMNGVAINNKTAFLYAVEDANNDYSYKAYTGYKNAPAYTSGASVAYVDDGVAVWIYVDVQASALNDKLDDLTFVAFDSDVKWTDEGDGVEYYEYAAVIDGVVTTLKVDSADGFDVVSENGYGFLADSISLDGDGIATALSLSTEPVEGDYTVKSGDGIVTINRTAYAYTDDVAVYYVDEDQAISIITVDDIEEDKNDDDYNPYEYIMAVLDDGKLDTIVVFEKK